LVLCYDCPCFWFNYKNNIHLVLILSLLSFFFFLVCRGLNDWLRCYCYVGLVAHFLFSSVWWWRAHAHKGLEYKPTTRAFTREFIVVIVIFVVVVCIYIYIYICVCECVSSFTLSLFAMRCGDVTCEVHFHPNHHHMLFSHIYNQCHLSCTHFSRTNECISMIIADYNYNNYHTIN